MRIKIPLIERTMVQDLRAWMRGRNAKCPTESEGERVRTRDV